MRSRGWLLAVVPSVVLPVLVLLLHDSRYLFYGDTQGAYLGWQYHLGTQLRAGHWPLLDPHAWQAGNLVAEGQAGLFSPVVMAIGLLATVSQNVLVFTAVTKLALLSVGALGVFVLARSYRASAPLAYAAAVAAPLGGMTQYLDLPSWVAQLMIWALLPWVWWALRRTVLLRANPLPALALGYLLVTVGYVYGTILLIFVLCACLVECRVTRDRAGAVRVVGVGVVCGLVALTVYLPGVLTAPVTIRGSGFAMTGKFAADPSYLLTSVLPTAAVTSSTLHLLPYAYAAWFLPVLVWLDVGRLRKEWGQVAGLLCMTGILLLTAFGPAQLGPLRWPLRLQPFLVQVLVVLWAVVLTRYAVRPSPQRLAGSLLWVGLAGVVAVVRRPDVWVAVVVGVVVVAAGVATVWLLVRTPRPARVALLGGVVAAFSLASMLTQHVYFPEPPSPERNLPTRAADYRTQLMTARGDVMVLGSPSAVIKTDPSAARDLLAGSAWYLNPHPVQNTYTTIGHTAFRDRYPYEYDGSTYPGSLDILFSREPTTGRLRVDLLGVSTLLLVRRDFPAARLDDPPVGWQVTDSAATTVTWVRRQPVQGAGHPVWESPGTTVSGVSADDRATRFEVDEVPAGGGKVVLSALSWPGYHTDVGSMAESVDGYLVTVDVPADAAGRTVTVKFSPPGWPVEVAAWWVAVLAGLVWSLLERRRARR